MSPKRSYGTSEWSTIFLCCFQFNLVQSCSERRELDEFLAAVLFFKTAMYLKDEIVVKIVEPKGSLENVAISPIQELFGGIPKVVPTQKHYIIEDMTLTVHFLFYYRLVF